MLIVYKVWSGYWDVALGWRLGRDLVWDMFSCIFTKGDNLGGGGAFLYFVYHLW